MLPLRRYARAAYCIKVCGRANRRYRTAEREKDTFCVASASGYIRAPMTGKCSRSRPRWLRSYESTLSSDHRMEHFSYSFTIAVAW
jgi:hypothetical protein